MIGRKGPQWLFTSFDTVTALPPLTGFVLPRAYNNVELPSFASEKRPSYSQTGLFGLFSRHPGWSLDSPGYLSTFRELLAEGGAPRIYRGLPLYLAKVAPAAAVQFGTYHLLKRLHRKYVGGGGDGGG